MADLHRPPTLGGLLAFVGFLSQLYGPARGLSRIPSGVSTAKAGVERLTEILDTEPTVTESANPRSLKSAKGHVAFNQVTFTYPGSERPVLRNLSFALKPGETLAVVGPSGSGKSTIARLLLRFVDPDRGCVTLDDVAAHELSLNALRENVTLLPEKTTVIHGTVSDNIAYGTERTHGVITTLVAVMGSSFEELDAREAAARARIGELRHRIAELIEPLAGGTGLAGRGEAGQVHAARTGAGRCWRWAARRRLMSMVIDHRTTLFSSSAGGMRDWWPSCTNGCARPSAGLRVAAPWSEGDRGVRLHPLRVHDRRTRLRTAMRSGRRCGICCRPGWLTEPLWARLIAFEGRLTPAND